MVSRYTAHGYTVNRRKTQGVIKKEGRREWEMGLGRGRGRNTKGGEGRRKGREGVSEEREKRKR
jgi:hypothetical protein